jgi:hypothetical protein
MRGSLAGFDGGDGPEPEPAVRALLDLMDASDRAPAVEGREVGARRYVRTSIVGQFPCDLHETASNVDLERDPETFGAFR